MNPPDRLLKKKCNCGNQLKLFSLVGINYVPEAVGTSVYTEQANRGILRVFPGSFSQRLLMGTAFISECTECGSITAWTLAPDEIRYLMSNEKEPGYGVGWIYNPENLKKQLEGFPDKSFADAVIRLAEEVDRANAGQSEARDG